MTLRERFNTPIVAALVLIGSLLRREYVEVGQWITVAALAFFIIASTVPTFKMVGNFKKLASEKKIKVLIYFVFIYVLVDAILTKTPNYFTIIALLAIDYLCDNTTEKKTKQKDKENENI